MIRIIKLNDEVEVEVEVDENQPIEISDNAPIDSSMDKIKDLLSKVMQPISNTYKELDKDMSIDSVKVVVGVKVGVEGNFILAKSSAGANIQVEMIIRTKNA